MRSKKVKIAREKRSKRAEMRGRNELPCFKKPKSWIPGQTLWTLTMRVGYFDSTLRIN
jgi:hypothetical protein